MKHPEVEAYLIREGYQPEKVLEFFAWHEKRRAIWWAFERKALEMLNEGTCRIGAKDIFEQIRKDPGMTSSTGWKVNNNYSAIYGRIFVYKYPRFKDRIEFRAVGKNIHKKAA